MEEGAKVAREEFLRYQEQNLKKNSLIKPQDWEGFVHVIPLVKTPTHELIQRKMFLKRTLYKKNDIVLFENGSILQLKSEDRERSGLQLNRIDYRSNIDINIFRLCNSRSKLLFIVTDNDNSTVCIFSEEIPDEYLQFIKVEKKGTDELGSCLLKLISIVKRNRDMQDFIFV